MDPELIAYLDQRFNSIDGRFEQVDRRFEHVEEANRETRSLIEETNRQTHALIEETNRQTRVLIEEVRDEVRFVAEGQVGLRERIENLEKQAAQTFDTVKGLIAPFYRELDGRIRALEDSDREPEEGQPRRRPQAAG